MRNCFLVACGAVLALAACSKSESKTEAPTAASSARPTLAPIEIPADGKLENVKVEGVTVPMIQLMENGQVLLVDTDGVKPRTWEEQYKRKSSELPRGYFDLHKSDTNKNNKFDDDAVDKQGRWKMDDKGNLTRD